MPLALLGGRISMRVRFLASDTDTVKSRVPLRWSAQGPPEFRCSVDLSTIYRVMLMSLCRLFRTRLH